jgi:threonine aldolase
MIDLRSDTVTRPSDAMRDAMYAAPVGDDVFGEDPSINALEAKLSAMFGHEAGLFCSSGTLANQIAINVHCSPGDQVICSWAAHIYHYEGGGMAKHSGVTAKLLPGERGIFTVNDVKSAILTEDIHFPNSRLVAIEDTCNKGGGSIWPMSNIEAISKICRQEGLALHLDGARLMNRIVADNTDMKHYGQLYDSISICLSKSLGAPVGSVLLGSSMFIKQARRVRKVMGGGMRQAGMLAAAGIYALDHNLDGLARDHEHAHKIAKALAECPTVSKVLPVETNIILFETKPEITAEQFIAELEKADIAAFATGEHQIRFVLHLDISSDEVDQIIAGCTCIKS